MSRISSYRNKDARLVAGVMSGTSLDGIDVALVKISGGGSELRYTLESFKEFPFTTDLRARILDASENRLRLREAFELDADLGGCYADAVRGAADEVGIDPDQLDAVGLHGQTVYHAPGRSPNGVTLQIGSAAVVAERLGTIVVNDFRTADVAAGGEGAPLVPYCDYVLLHSDDANRVALNIGGIANITWLPASARSESLVAFDTGPGNMLIDAAMRALFQRGYDAGGEIASTGTPDTEWLQEILGGDYYHLPPPKSAGRENFGEETSARLVATGRSRGLGNADIIATLTLLTARSIAEGIRRFASKGESVDEVIVGGGGARNATMLRMLGDELNGVLISPADRHGLPADAKEAICFAILANEALMEIPANVPSVTGASHPVICGAIRIG